MIWLQTHQKKLLRIVLPLTIGLGYFLFQWMTSIPFDYEYYDKDLMPLSCDVEDGVVVDNYQDYVNITTACEIDQTVQPSYFDDGFIVFYEQFSSMRRQKSPRVNKSIFNDGGTITIRLARKSYTYDGAYRIYAFELQKDQLNMEDISIRVTRESDD